MDEEKSMHEKLARLRKDYERTQNKLEKSIQKSIRKSKAKAHVRKILHEQEMLRKKEKEHKDFKDYEINKKGTEETAVNNVGSSCSLAVNVDNQKTVQVFEPPGENKLLSEQKPVFLSDPEKCDLVTLDNKTIENKKITGSSLTDGQCTNSEKSVSSGSLPSSAESNGKRSLSLKARRRKTLSPNTFSRKKNAAAEKAKPPANETVQPDLCEGEGKENVNVESDDTEVKLKDDVKGIPPTSSLSEITESPNAFDSELDLFPSSLETCEKIKTKRKRGRPPKHRRASLPARMMVSNKSLSESQESPDMGTLMLVQESLGVGSPIERRKTRNSRSCQPILLSSLFQYIIDEAKRKQDGEDFVLPTNVFGKLMNGKDLAECDFKVVIDNIEDEKEKEEQEQDLVSTSNPVTVKYSIDRSTTGEIQCLSNEEEIKQKLKEECKKKAMELPETMSSPAAQCDAISDTVDTQKGVNSMVVPDAVCESTENRTSASEEMQVEKDLQLDADHNMEEKMKKTDETSPPAKPCDQLISQGAHQFTTMTEVQHSEEDSHTENDLNNSLSSDQQTESDDDNFGDILQGKLAAQFSLDDPVIQSFVTIVPLNKKKTDVVVCLCKKSLSVFGSNREQFVCLQKWAFPVGQTALKGDMMLPKSSEVRFVAIVEEVTECQIYSAVFHEDKGFPLFKISHISVSTEQVHVCSVGFNEVIISQSNYDFIHLMKYTMDYESKSLLRTTSLEEVTGALENVCRIQGQPQGVVGYTKDGLLHIWNHEVGVLAVTINLAVYWPHSSHLVTVYHEKGYLFCPLLASSDCFLAGCMMLVNPTNCQTKVLFPFNSKKWKGCRSAFALEEYIVAVNNSGFLHIWDKFNGEMVSCMENADVTGMSCHRNNLILSRPYCLHCFTLK